MDSKGILKDRFYLVKSSANPGGAMYHSKGVMEMHFDMLKRKGIKTATIHEVQVWSNGKRNVRKIKTVNL